MDEDEDHGEPAYVTFYGLIELGVAICGIVVYFICKLIENGS